MSDMEHDDDIDIDVAFDQSEAVICCRILYTLMMADDEFTVREQVFLKNTMDQLGLHDEEREMAKQTMSEDEAREAAAALPPEVSKALLDALFQVALVDGHMANAEMRYITSLRKFLTNS